MFFERQDTRTHDAEVADSQVVSRDQLNNVQVSIQEGCMLLTKARLHAQHSRIKSLDDGLDEGPFSRVCYLPCCSPCDIKSHLMVASCVS